MPWAPVLKTFFPFLRVFLSNDTLTKETLRRWWGSEDNTLALVGLGSRLTGDLTAAL
jgi:hypothetical protein